jgi:hypothetical protein
MDNIINGVLLILILIVLFMPITINFIFQIVDWFKK